MQESINVQFRVGAVWIAGLKHTHSFSFLQACDLLQGLIPQKDDKDTSILTKDHYERLYVFIIMWCIGAFLELDDR